MCVLTTRGRQWRLCGTSQSGSGETFLQAKAAFFQAFPSNEVSQMEKEKRNGKEQKETKGKE